MRPCTRSLWPGLILAALLTALAGCEAFDAVTGGVTRPIDPGAPPATQPVPPAVVAVQEAAAQAELALVQIGAAIAQAEVDAVADPSVAAEVARLKALHATVAAQLARYRAILDASAAAWQASQNKPAGETITGVLGPVAQSLPFPANLWGGLIVAGLGVLGTAIQTYRLTRRLSRSSPSSTPSRAMLPRPWSSPSRSKPPDGPSGLTPSSLNPYT